MCRPSAWLGKDLADRAGPGVMAVTVGLPAAIIEKRVGSVALTARSRWNWGVAGRAWPHRGQPGGTDTPWIRQQTGFAD